MAGHSHSSNIKFRKDRVDSKRAKTFAKLSRMITVAARQGGGSADGNPRLRLAMEKARVLSMPKDAIDRAIRKGTGEGDLGNYEEVLYEGYGPGGVALMLEILTDNRHRTAADVRGILDKYGGNLGTSGAVGWMFTRRGRFVLDPIVADPKAGERSRPLGEDALLELVLEVGAEDFAADGDTFVIYCAPGEFAEVHDRLTGRGIALRQAELAHVPTQRVAVADLAIAQRLVKAIDALDDHDDVQSVFSNEDFPDDVARGLEA